MPSGKLEQRVAELESEVAVLKKRLDALDGTKPWWERIAGSFCRDPAYEEAMRLGRKYRASQRPHRRKKKQE